jgi:hypothetical protein
VDFKTTQETIRELYYEIEQHKPWFNNVYTKLLEQRKRAKFQWLQDLSQTNANNLNCLRFEDNWYFRNKKGKCLEDKINVFATHTKSKNIRDIYRQINDFKRGYQPRTDFLQDENGDVLAYSH